MIHMIQELFGQTLSVLAEVFDTDIVSEHEPRFWGFDSQEEWDADREQRARENRDRFYLKIINYLRGERNTDEIRPGTIGERLSQIAQKLVERDPSLLQPEAKEKLMASRKRSNAIFRFDDVCSLLHWDQPASWPLSLSAWSCSIMGGIGSSMARPNCSGDTPRDSSNCFT